LGSLDDETGEVVNCSCVCPDQFAGDLCEKSLLCDTDQEGKACENYAIAQGVFDY